VLAQCAALAQLDLGFNSIGPAGAEQGQRALQECWSSAQRWLTLISATMASKLSGEGGFERRGVVKLLDFFSRHLALLAL
jgi:hypothetical protein